jgi:anti-sigma regulatory factor (Ser/Thr protein kinase)
MTVLCLPRDGSKRRTSGHSGLRLRPDPTELGRAREFADTAAERFGLDRPGRDDFKLAASEAVANAIEHGLPLADGAIHVWADEGEEALTLAVRNRGEFVFRPTPLDPLADRGRGFTVMTGLVDRVALIRIGDEIQIELSKGRSDGNG